MKLVDRVAADTGFDAEYIRKIALTASHRYKVYSVPKRTGGRRTIMHPSRELKFIQTWLAENLFAGLPVSDAVFSYRVGRSIRAHANVHRRYNYLLKVDLKDFFPSISGGDIFRFLSTLRSRGLVELVPSEMRLIASLACRDDRVTIGAPSSPALTNCILYDFDVAMTAACKAREVVYTRYADDLFFSTNVPDVLSGVYKLVRKALSELPYLSLRINQKKTVFTSRKRSRLVTGVVLTSDKRLSLGRTKKRELKTLVYLFSVGELDERKSSYLTGSLAYAASIEPRFISALERKFGAEVLNGVRGIAPLNLKPKSRSAPGFRG